VAGYRRAAHDLGAYVCFEDEAGQGLRPLADFAEENKAWLRLYRLPAYAPDLNPAEGIWSLLKRAMVNFAATGLKIETLVTTCVTNSTWDS
jgi:DDE superfamily endonuclease